MFAWDGYNVFIPKPQMEVLESAQGIKKLKKYALPIVAVLIVGIILFVKGK
jgi:hypothetical protein